MFVGTLRVAHRPPPAGGLTSLQLFLNHPQIPHPKLPAIVKNGAIEEGVSVIGRSLWPAADDRIRGVLLRRDQRQLQIVLPREAVVVEGKEDDFLTRRGRRGRAAPRSGSCTKCEQQKRAGKHDVSFSAGNADTSPERQRRGPVAGAPGVRRARCCCSCGCEIHTGS